MSGYVKQELRLPAVIAERCVHERIAAASCRRCVDACPRGAWSLGDDMLGLDAERCDGCGLCVPACPESALAHEQRLAVRYWRGRQLAIGACEQAGVTGAVGAVPCLHSTGLTELIHLYKQGCNTLIVARGDCDGCARGQALRLDENLRRVNQLLMSRELPPMELKPLSARQWPALLRRTQPEESARDLSRRDFFGRALGRALTETARGAGRTADSTPQHHPPGRLPGGDAAAHLMPAVPAIDSARCDGCDACVNLCPHGALSLQESEPGELAYRIDASGCTGCGICSDVCEAQAIEFSCFAPVHRRTVALRTGQCGRCGAGFHFPAGQREHDGLCRVCSRVNHHSNLFQVLD